MEQQPLTSSAKASPSADFYYQQQQYNQQELTKSVNNFRNLEQQWNQLELDPAKSDHPTVALSMFVLKGLPFLCYFFLGIFVSRQWTIPEVMIVIASIDFWVTKNICGRLLVGLKWWEEIDEATEQQLWVFECRAGDQPNKLYPTSIIAPLTRVITVLAWGGIGVVNALAFNFMQLIGIGFCFLTNGANLYFFFRCKRVQKQRAKQLAQALGAEVIKKIVNTSVIWPLRPPTRKGA